MDREFHFDTEIEIRYRDLDTLGHVNNTVYGTYLEQARFRYFDAVLDVPFEDRELVLVDLHIEYHRPMTLEDGIVRIECGVVELGESSFRMAYRLYAEGDETPAVTAETVLVAWDGDGSRPVPDEWRQRFKTFEPAL